MKNLKAIIVEDEEASRVTLNNYLARYCKNVDVLDMADSVKSGLNAIQKHQPDVVFLDIEMPFGNAFDLLESLNDINFEIIFVTAYRDYAIKALNLSAAYYILKPIDIDELINAVNKITERKKEGEDVFHTRILMDNIKSNSLQHKKIVLPQMDGFEVIKVNEIIRAEADDNYTKFYLQGGKTYLVSKTLKHFDELLCEFDFIRVHKSHLVNLHHIAKYIKGKGGQVQMSDDSLVDVSPTRKKELIDKFS
ncbi:MAG: response regulator transcription factor [Flavobacteriales bacterium]|nr:response regulator transcription factor [Flavobacteriales bacterium]